MLYVIMSKGFEGKEPGELVDLSPEEVNAHIAAGHVFALPHTTRRIPAPFRSPEQAPVEYEAATEAEIEAAIAADAEAEVAIACEAEAAEVPVPSTEVSSEPLSETVPEA